MQRLISLSMALLCLLCSCSALGLGLGSCARRLATARSTQHVGEDARSRSRSSSCRSRSSRTLAILNAESGGDSAEADGDGGRGAARKRRMKGKRAMEGSGPPAAAQDGGNGKARSVTQGTVFMLDDKMPVFSTSDTLKASPSKLPPLTGTLEARQANFNEKSGVERALEEYLAPTPAGKEPKFFQLMKTVTWGAVVLLVLTEIVVSLKVGGAPFDLQKVSLPALPKFSLFDLGKDLP